MNKNVDLYFVDGCGRCSLGGTPECKVNKWPNELRELRRIVLECGLTEESKWGMPCYSYKGANVLILSAFKEFCSLNFFKGSLLNDENNILAKAGPNSHVARIAKFTDIDTVLQQEPLLKALINQAIENEIAGIKVESTKVVDLKLPDELVEIFDEDAAFKMAFEALTPGRQKGYIYHFAQPKQSKTRMARIEKWMDKIFEGKGLQDDYKAKAKK